MKLRYLFLSVSAFLLSIPIHAQQAQPSMVASATAEQPDKYQWLEDVNGDRSLAWVKAENARTEKAIEGDPRYPGFEAAALKILESPDRLPLPEIHGNEIYNTWQDAQHVQGIFRRAAIADYLTAEPHWQTVIDYDALGRQDNEKWVPHGLQCLHPGDSLCLVALSAGGEDAETVREFDLGAGKFVGDGFNLPRSKQTYDWLDKDTLLVARDWGTGSMTASGYPFIIKEWKRGQQLDQAREVFRGSKSDEIAYPVVLHDGAGNQAVLFIRNVNFFESEMYLFTPAGARRVALPGKSQVEGMVAGQLLVTINEDWTPEGQEKKFVQGSVVSIDLEAVSKDPVHLKPAVLFAPTATEFPQQVATAKNHAVLTTLEHVQGRAYVCTLDKSGNWAHRKLDVPDDLTVEVSAYGLAHPFASVTGDRFFLQTTGFISPPALLLGDASSGAIKEVKTIPPQFDASGLVVEQFAATSRDGTKVPYFVVRRKDLKFVGANPTILTAYGGFQVSEMPAYNAVTGKLWLEHGGVFVSANIRGGGEFGPAWHEAGLKTHRQTIYDDFYAVAQDLITRKITSPRRLGIEGGSNGGLLMGVQMTEHPEMYQAIAIDVPLLDMLRFEQIAAGASWVGEYGTVSKPEERIFLASISPYNQLMPNVTYPEPLIFTTTKDDRVGPVHARKFAARMEEFNKPFFYFEIIEGGHGAGADLKERARTRAVHSIYFTQKLVD